MIARRTLFLLLLALWQGGFAFYGGIVVPVGTRVLESATEQGFITQQVTTWLNMCGFAALFVWLVVLLRDRPAQASLRWPLILWTGLLVALVGLVMLHGRMDRLLDADAHSVLEPRRFYDHHRVYLLVSTLQWLGAIGLLAMTLRRWEQLAGARG